MSKILNLLKALCDFLYKVKDVTFPLAVNRKRPMRSIVRFIGTNLPIPIPPRIYINIPSWKRSLDKKISQATIQSDVSTSSNEDSVISRGESELPCDCTYFSCMHETKITQLQNDLKELREQVASILLKNAPCSNSSDKEKSESCELLPPPPPPPLPPPFDISSPFITPKRKPLATRNRDNISNCNPLGDVLKEIKNGPPKLKPIERSPGGRPVKRPRILTDPSDILTEVLKKRFLAAHMSSDTNDSDISSQQDNSQSDWNSCFD